MSQDLGEAHDRELSAIEPGPAAGGFHARTGDAGELGRGKAPPQRVDEGGTGRTPRRLACHQRHAHRYRTRLRVDSPMKSTKIRSSGWDSARAFSSVTASASLRSERYNTRYAFLRLRICSGVKPRRLRPSELMECGTAGVPTAITYGGTSRVTAALLPMKACAPTLVNWCVPE